MSGITTPILRNANQDTVQLKKVSSHSPILVMKSIQTQCSDRISSPIGYTTSCQVLSTSITPLFWTLATRFEAQHRTKTKDFFYWERRKFFERRKTDSTTNRIQNFKVMRLVTMQATWANSISTHKIREQSRIPRVTQLPVARTITERNFNSHSSNRNFKKGREHAWRQVFSSLSSSKTRGEQQQRRGF